MKKIFTIFTSLVLMLVLCMPAMAKGENTAKSAPATQTTQADKQIQQRLVLPNNVGTVSLLDMAGLLKPDQQSKLLQRLNQLEKQHNVRIVVMTVPRDSRTGTDLGIKKFADDTLNKYYRDEANNNGSIMMVVCPDARKWAVTTDNNMRQRITDENGYPAIKDYFMEDLKNNNYDGAFNDYADKVDELLTYYEEEGEPWDPANEFSVLGFILAAALSGLIGYLFVGHLRGNMSNVRRVNEANEYLDKASVEITNQSDVFLHTTRVVTKRPKHDDSSDSSSGGNSSSNGGGSGSY